MSKLSIHCQSLVGEIGEILAPMEYVKVMDPPEENPFPGKKVIARTFDSDETSYVLRGNEGAIDWFNKWLPFYRRRPWVYAWEAPNEPNPMWDLALRRGLDGFTEELSALMAGAGLRLVAYNLSVGWFDIGQVKEFERSLRAILKYGHFMGLHEYGAPFMNVVGHKDGQHYWTLRYRRTFSEIKALGLPVPKTFITECGIDGLVRTDDWEPNQELGWPGWKYFCISDKRTQAEGEDMYMSQLVWYDEELMQDPDIVAAFIFNSGDRGGWSNFELTPRLLNRIASYVAANPTKKTPPQEDLVVVDLVGKLPTRGKIPKRSMEGVDLVVVHHTAVKVKLGQPRTYYTGVHLPAIARGHTKTNGWNTIGYHYAVDDQGRIYKLNALDTLSNHTFGHNERGIGIVLTGAFHETYNKTSKKWESVDPTPAQIESTARLIRMLDKPFEMHSKLVGTQCPGATDHNRSIRSWWSQLQKLVKGE
jgi:hypothetical protein